MLRLLILSTIICTGCVEAQLPHDQAVEIPVIRVATQQQIGCESGLSIPAQVPIGTRVTTLHVNTLKVVATPIVEPADTITEWVSITNITNDHHNTDDQVIEHYTSVIVDSSEVRIDALKCDTYTVIAAFTEHDAYIDIF